MSWALLALDPSGCLVIADRAENDAESGDGESLEQAAPGDEESSFYLALGSEF